MSFFWDTEVKNTTPNTAARAGACMEVDVRNVLAAVEQILDRHHQHVKKFGAAAVAAAMVNDTEYNLVVDSLITHINNYPTPTRPEGDTKTNPLS